MHKLLERTAVCGRLMSTEARVKRPNHITGCDGLEQGPEKNENTQ